jgi:hypothetical protein
MQELCGMQYAIIECLKPPTCIYTHTHVGQHAYPHVGTHSLPYTHSESTMLRIRSVIVSCVAYIPAYAHTNTHTCSEEVNAFATLPADEKRLRELRDDVKEYEKKEDIDATETFVAKEKLRHDKVTD